ncbi:MAG TPA: lanthionine synthetase C family protein [Kofleriaceae bacterium]|nr:lanthionine synthetase C family protein [Kofleriaceae bacterium]
MNPRARGAWRPLLDGAQADRARETLDALAGALDGELAAVASPALLDGAASRALVFAYLDRAWPDRGHAERTARWLDRAVERLAEQPMAEGLYAGFTGVAWVVEHLAEDCADSDADAADASAAIDDELRDRLRGAPGTGLDHDLTDGLTGLGVYALERLPRASGAELLALVVERLCEAAETHGDGVTWRSTPERMLAETRAEYPSGYHDMGVAHGVPGPIALLAGACAAGVAGPRARPLLDGAWRWMLANRLPPGEGSTFPLWQCADRPAQPARSAWCYGDPGAARAMFVAARAIGSEPWARVALAIARQATARPRDRCGCDDPGLCHGAAGLAHLANRMWQDTGDPTFADAARGWYDDALAMPRPDDPSFLTGAAGIALALAAALAPVEPAWDRVLLASLPPPRSRST